MQSLSDNPFFIAKVYLLNTYYVQIPGLPQRKIGQKKKKKDKVSVSKEVMVKYEEITNLCGLLVSIAVKRKKKSVIKETSGGGWGVGWGRPCRRRA